MELYFSLRSYFPLSLAGPIPPEVGALSELLVLTLDGNKLTGTVRNVPI